MLNKIKILAVAAAILGATGAVEVTPANAAYMHGWNGGGNWHGGGCWNCGGGAWWGPAIGLGAGLAFGALLAQPYYGGYYAPYYGGYYAPRYAYAPRYRSSVAYCQAKFRSYDVATRTYVGYDGIRHYC
jgi:hypothetical protein